MNKVHVSIIGKAAVRVLAAAAMVALPLAGAGPAAQEKSPRLAKVAAAQNVVESRKSGAEAWTGATVGEELRARDRVRTGASSRAAILYADDTLHRLDEKSEVEIVPRTEDSPGLIKVLSGRHYFTSRKPTDFGRVETATVTAAIKGTEFAVDVAESGATTITMIEGVVLASNPYGSLEVGAGERAVVEPGKAPVRSIVVRPRDAVAWALYYPPVLGGSDAARLRGMGEDGAELSRAAGLLSTGQVEQAKSIVDSVRSRRPSDPVALSLATVIALEGDRKDEARRLSGEAVAAGGDSAAAALAASYVAQSEFDIAMAGALAERAAQLDPNDPTALARAAEMRMAQGDIRGARRAASDALERAPDDARSLTVLGFVELARLRSWDAEKLFERAIASDSGLATAHLGMGIARLRLGDLTGGREQIQSAAILDPGNSLIRSYLGKAYYEEKRSRESGKELEAAKGLDPSDPTPWLYSAILLQSENRPVEALGDLMQSMKRNDNRAVYRSRLLLDEDQAVRSADQARIFNDLGFEDAGLVAARRSADEDQANHSGHLLLSGNYRNLPFYAPAFLSEVLQARIYQPLSANAARPDLVNASASFNEYTALFDRPRARFFGNAAYGTTNTDLSAFGNGEMCGDVPCYKLQETEDSNIRSGAAVVTVNADRYAAAISYQSYRDDGFRRNADQSNGVGRGFVQVAASDSDTLQLNFIRADRTTGDLPLRQELPAIVPERFDTDETNVGLGWHRRISPSSDLAVSAIWNDTEQVGMDLSGVASGTATLTGPQLEVQWVTRSPRTTWVFGGGQFSGSVELASPGAPEAKSDDTFTNGYGYARLHGMGPDEITLGAAFERVLAPIGFLPPRDSNIFTANLPYERTEFSPKLGITALLGKGTTLRGGVYHRLAPFIGRLQTLEPTQVAGFNQFFEDVGGSRSWNWGVGVDQVFGRTWFLGASYTHRNVGIPEAYCDRATEWSDSSGCAFHVPSTIEQRESHDGFVNVYASAALTHWMAATIGYDDQDQKFNTTFVVPPAGVFQDHIHTKRLRPEVRFFTPQGFFARVAGTRYDQSLDQFDTLDPATATSSTRSSTFWIADAAIGYRFPKRWGSIALDGRNLLNKKFEVYERSIQETVIPARTVVARLEITY